MKNYKIGDLVKVKKSLKEGITYEGYLFTEEMKKLRGKTFTISEVLGDRYRLKGIKEIGFTPEMLKPVKKRKLDPKLKEAFRALKLLAKLVDPCVKPLLIRPPYHQTAGYHYVVLRKESYQDAVLAAFSEKRTILSFKSIKKADKFKAKYADLIEIAKPLL